MFRATAALVLAGLSWGAQAQTAKEIVARADRVRNPGDPFRLTMTLTEYISGKAQGQNVLAVYSKEDPSTRQFRNLVRYLQPPRDAGKIVLLDGRSFWFYDPTSKSSVRISPQQRLIGQAAVGDVLTVNLAVDYLAELTSTETISDSTHKPRVCWHLELKAANDLSTYSRIEYWIEQGTYLPMKMKFYSDSGRLLKILYYRAFEKQLGSLRPTEAVILDSVDSTRVTTTQSTDYRLQDIPEASFQRESLPRFLGE